MTFSPDGRRLATAAYNTWDASTGQELVAVSPSSNGLLCGVAFSPDGRRLATASSTDKTARIWVLSDDE